MPWMAAVIPAIARVIEPMIMDKLGNSGLGQFLALNITPATFWKRKLGIEPAPGKGGSNSVKADSPALKATIRSAVEPRRIIYGEARVGGPMVFADVTTPSSTFGKSWLHLILPLASHEIEAIGWGSDTAPGVILIDSYVWTNDGNARFKLQADSAGDTSGANDIGPLWYFGKHLGADDQTADATLISLDTNWTSAHRLRGMAYLYARLRSDPDVWTTGIPNISAIVRGKKCYDPRASTVDILSVSVANPGVFTTDGVHGLSIGQRIFIDGMSGTIPTIAKEFQVASVPTTSTFTVLGNDGSGSIGESLAVTTGLSPSAATLSVLKWTDNAALCILDYLLAPWGFNCDLDEIDAASFIAAANICDEMVALTETSDTFTADASTDIISRPQLTNPVARGDGVQLTTTGTLPAGLSLATTYYYIPWSPTISNAEEDAGQPTGFNGKLATSLANARAGTAINITDAGTGVHTLVRKSQPRYTVNGVVTMDEAPTDVLQKMMSSCGATVTYTQGEFRIKVAAFTAAAVTLNEDDLRGDLTIRTRTERKDLFNTVRGAFVDPFNNYQPTDFPQITAAALKTEDGGEEITRDIELPFESDITRCQRLAKIILLRGRTGGRAVDFPAKLTALRIAPEDTVGLTIAQLSLSAETFEVDDWTFTEDFGIDLKLSQVESSDFTWTASEAATPDRPATLNLIVSSYAGSPGLSLSEDTVETTAGDTVVRLLVTITPPTGTIVDSYQVEYKLSTDTNYTQLGVGPQTLFTLTGVTIGATYNVRARTVSGSGAISEYATASRTIDGPPPAGGTMWDSIAGNIDSWVPSIDAM